MASYFVCCAAEPLETAHGGTKRNQSSNSLGVDDSVKGSCVRTTIQVVAVQLRIDYILRNLLLKCHKKKVFQVKAGNLSSRKAV